METEILGLRMSVKSLTSKSDAVQLSIKGEVLRVTDLVLIENQRLRDALKEIADNSNWLYDTEYRTYEWQGDADNPASFAQEALKETE